MPDPVETPTIPAPPEDCNEGEIFDVQIVCDGGGLYHFQIVEHEENIGVMVESRDSTVKGGCGGTRGILEAFRLGAEIYRQGFEHGRSIK